MKRNRRRIIVGREDKSALNITGVCAVTGVGVFAIGTRRFVFFASMVSVGQLSMRKMEVLLCPKTEDGPRIVYGRSQHGTVGVPGGRKNEVDPMLLRGE